MDWTNHIDKVNEMISAKGVAATIKVSTPSAHNATTDSYTQASASYSAKVLFTKLENRDEAGKVTVIEDGLVLVPAKGLPRIDDISGQVSLTISAKVYSPISIDALQPGGDPLMYKVRIK